MSGHSKWSTIKRQKGVNDKKRAALFAKLMRAVALAAREGGNNPQSNPKLRLAVERAKGFNVPKQNIERALEHREGETIEAFMFDAIGPGNASLLIEGATDNKNRTINEIRIVLGKHEAKMTQEGSVRWAFVRKGVLVIEKAQLLLKGDDALFALINVGSEDVKEADEVFEAIVDPEDLDAVRTKCSQENIPIADASLNWVPKQEVQISQKDSVALAKLVAELEDHPDIQDVWTNEP